jgi:ribonuclease HI
MSTQVYLYVDGSCRGNPGPGGYAAILQYGEHEREIVGGQDHTTNNRMELSAVIAGLKAFKRRCRVVIVTDSQYVATMLSSGRAKANLDLVQELHQLASRHEVQIRKVSGHSGHVLNERADRLAHAEATQRLGRMAVADP